jgi:hypothetical protein
LEEHDVAGTGGPATFTLLGLRYEAALAEQLFGELANMEESTTYQAILSRGGALGRVDEARDILLRQGRKKLGEPDAITLAAIDGITSHERLEELMDRVPTTSTWQELLASEQ